VNLRRLAIAAVLGPLLAVAVTSVAVAETPSTGRPGATTSSTRACDEAQRASARLDASAKSLATEIDTITARLAKEPAGAGATRLHKRLDADQAALAKLQPAIDKAHALVTARCSPPPATDPKTAPSGSTGPDGHGGPETHVPATLMLTCQRVTTNNHPTVNCTWSGPTPVGFSKFVLGRAADNQGRIVFTSADASTTQGADTDPPAKPAGYVLFAVDASGKAVAHSGLVTA
jgi:hypothetical protein